MTVTRVAHAAGVAPSTASRYLRGQLNVAPDTAARIDAAVREVGYRPPGPAAAEASGEPAAPVIGLLVPELENPFFSSIADELSAVAAAAGCTLTIVVAGRDERRERAASRAVRSTVDGMLYVGMFPDNPELAAAIGGGLPAVVLDQEPDGSPPVDTVTADNFGGAYQATAYLAQLGHRRIAHIGGPQGLSTTRQRLSGFRGALEHAGIPPDEQVVLHGPYTEHFGANTLPYLAAADPRPTAVFVGSDIVAVGVLGAAGRHGLRVPDDLSVVGCDGIRVGEWLTPRLTTLQAPVKDVAQTALNMLLARTEGSSDPVEAVRHPLQLLVRDSAAPPQPDAAGR
jgi:LacI family transcriptional regulator/LacI family repressor for deo operon, udp, cdd, tsx, nupC, and nupG